MNIQKSNHGMRRGNVMPTPRAGARGFSLIEILIVMALIAVVGGMVARNVAGGRQKGLYNAARTQVQQVSGKIEEYALDVGSPPETIDALLTAPSDASNWNGPYVKAKDLKDPWGSPWQYRAPGEHDNEYDLWSFGADKKEGGEKYNKDIGNWE